GSAIEYAVKMRAFPQQALWSERIKLKCLSVTEIDALATKIGNFHRNTTTASKHSTWGSAETIRKTASDNLALIALLSVSVDERAQISKLEIWQVVQHQKLTVIFELRKENGMIKECHGDLHSGNIITLNDQIEVFDCIEFNESLRWIDVMNDIAFICIDLHIQDKPNLAARFLNQYLELTGDYDGLDVLHYYQIERALVRCKVSLMRARQLRSATQDAAFFEKQATRYLTFSVESIKKKPAAIIITHGFSGSGKSTFSKRLVELVGAIQIRSDVERKRMHGLSVTSREGAAPDAALYATAATQLTYDRLLLLARHIVESGMSVIVDAAFLKGEQRKRFENLARDLRVPFFIFDVYASEATMGKRIAFRSQLNQDPSDAGVDVLAAQLQDHDPLSEDEKKCTVAVNSEQIMEMDDLKKITAPIIAAMKLSTQ
ncbi:MAG: bifunctional aminoglycoside phosphotransferase/ATP-binding protein, partial [Burkholderiaceae bacterium]